MLASRAPATQSAQEADTVSFTENELGVRTAMSDLSGTTVYNYDTQNRLVEVRKTWNAVAGLPPFTSSLYYSYDDAGRLVKVHSSNVNGLLLEYGYDSANRLVEVLDPHSGRTVYNYDEAGNLLGCTYPNGQTGIVTPPVATVATSDTQLGSVSTSDGGTTTTLVYDGDGKLVLSSVVSSTRTLVTYGLVDPLSLTGVAAVVEELTADSNDPLLGTPTVLRVNTFGYDLISQDQFVNGDWVLTFSP